MSIFFYILGHNIAPIFIIIMLGYLISKKYDLNVLTLTKFNFYLFSPAFIFVNLYTTTLDMAMIKIIFFSTVYLVTNDLFSRVIARVRKYDIGQTNAFKNSIMFNNTGNIGLSLIALVFSSDPFVINGNTPYLDEALSVLIMIMVFTNVTSYTIGFYNAGRATMDFKKAILKIFTMPPIYIIPLVFIFKNINVDLTATIFWPALIYLKDGLISIALLTLGVQLSKTKFSFKNTDVFVSVFSRLIIGPILSIVYISIFGFTSVIAQTVLISHSVPTAVNTALIAVECRNNEEFATQAVLISTVLSSITLPIFIYVARMLYPI